MQFHFYSVQVYFSTHDPCGYGFVVVKRRHWESGRKGSLQGSLKASQQVLTQGQSSPSCWMCFFECEGSSSVDLLYPFFFIGSVQHLDGQLLKKLRVGESP